MKLQVKTRPANPLPEFPAMAPAELADLSKEAGRSLTSSEQAHRYRLRRLREKEAEHFVYGSKS